MKTQLEKMVIESMIDELSNIDGCETYGFDLGFEIFQDANNSGSFTYSTYESIQWIKNNFEDLGDIVNDYKDCYDCEPCNPFDEPEKFQVQIMLYLSDLLIQECKTVSDNWDNKILLEDETLSKIIDELKELLK